MLGRSGLTLTVPIALLALVRCEVVFPRQTQHDGQGGVAAMDAGTGGTGGDAAAGSGGTVGNGGTAGSGGSGGTAGGAGGTGGGAAGTGGTTGDPCSGQCNGSHSICSATGVCGCSAGYTDTDGNPGDNSATCDKSSIIQSLTVTVGVQHPHCGELTYKLAHGIQPMTLMSRPGAAEAADDGSGNLPGNQAKLSGASPLTFDDAAATSAEDMGATTGAAQTVCLDSGICQYHPDKGAAAGPGTLAAAFAGTDSIGTWQLCVGDSMANASGSLQNWSISFVTPGGTQTYSSGSISVSIPDDGYNGSLGSMGCNQIKVP